MTGFINGMCSFFKKIGEVFVDVVTTSAADLMKILPVPFKIFPDSFAGFLMFLSFWVAAIVIGIGCGYLAKTIFKKSKNKELYWYGFAIGFIIPFIVLIILPFVV